MSIKLISTDEQAGKAIVEVDGVNKTYKYLPTNLILRPT